MEVFEGGREPGKDSARDSGSNRGSVDPTSKSARYL
jgi:hypothetical protein